MAFTEVPRPQTTFDELKSWILDGSLSPGQRLPVRDVAKGMGVSPTPVREALVRLRDAGLVTQERNRGAVVGRLTLAALHDYYGLRRLLEPPSLRIGVEHITPERLTRVYSTMAALEDAVSQQDHVATLNLDEDLLILIHDAVGNKEIARVIRSTWQRIRPYKLFFMAVAQSDAGAQIIRENTRLIEAAERRDGTDAHDMMFVSLDNAHLRIGDLLRSQDTEHAGSRILHGEDLAATLGSLHERSRIPA